MICIRIFGGDSISKIMDMMNLDDDEPIEASMVSKSIENAQKKVEAHNFSIRKHVLEYDNVMNQQREFIYADRKKILRQEDLSSNIKKMI